MSEGRVLPTFGTNTRKDYETDKLELLAGLSPPRRSRKHTPAPSPLRGSRSADSTPAPSTVKKRAIQSPNSTPTVSNIVFVSPNQHSNLLDPPPVDSPVWDNSANNFAVNSFNENDITINRIVNCRVNTPSLDTIFSPNSTNFAPALDTIFSPRPSNFLPSFAPFPSPRPLPTPVLYTTAPSQLSNNNTNNMSALDDHKERLGEIHTIYDEDFEGTEIEMLALNTLEGKQKDLIKLRNEFRESLNYVKKHDRDFFNNVTEEMETVKSKILNTLRKVECKIGALSKAPAVSAPPTDKKTPEQLMIDQFKIDKVNDSFTTNITLLDSLKSQFIKLMSRNVTNDVEFYSFEEECRYKFRATEDIIREAKILETDALSVNRTREAMELTQRISLVRNYILNIEAKIYKLREELGLFGTSLADKNINLELPQFGGKNGLDYFTFKARFEKYISLVRMSAAKQLHLLKVDCILDEGLRLNLNRFSSKGEIFDFLEKHYGDSEALLYEKREEILSCGKFPWYERSRGNPTPTKQRDWLLKVDSKLRELRDLAEEHDIGNNLYYSDLIYRVESFFPEQLKDEYIDLLSQHPNKLNGKDMYLQFISFLSNLICRYTVKCNHFSATQYGDASIKKESGEKSSSSKPTNMHTLAEEDGHDNQQKRPVKKGNNLSKHNKASKIDPAPKTEPEKKPCPLECGMEHTHLFYCQEYTSLTDFRKRFNLCREHKVCMRCLRLDTTVDFQSRDLWWQSHQDNCITEFACKAGYCKDRKVASQTHMLNCVYHYQQNKPRENDFIESLDSKQHNPDVSFFSLLCLSSNYAEIDESKIIQNAEPDICEPSIFMNHEITVCGKELTIFYDSGAEGAAISSRGYKFIDCINVKPGPTVLSVAGGELLKIEGGDERFSLDLYDGNKASITGLKMNNITTSFPTWETFEVMNEIKAYQKNNYPNIDLPGAPKSFGGKPVDILLGIKYLKYYPKLLFSLPCGLSIYESRFKCSNNNQLVLGGPHKAWRGAFDKTKSLASMMFFLSNEARTLRVESQFLSNIMSFDRKEDDALDQKVDSLLAELVPEDDHECPAACKEEQCVIATMSRVHSIKTDGNNMEKVDNIGTEASYRCLKCRGCKECLKGDYVELVSLNEELEQKQIEDGVRYDEEECRIYSSLPFTKDPVTNLTPNKHIAAKVFNTQKKLWTSNPEVKEDLLSSFNKLESNGFVFKLSTLSARALEKFEKSSGAPYFIPWRSVYKPKSLSSKCRIVFDGSSRTPSAESLNSCLAMGKNLLSSLYQILLRFRGRKFGVTCDVRLAYNQIKLEEDDYKYQLILWQDNLDPDEPLSVYIVGTMIYGIRPSGTITIVAFRLLGNAVMCDSPEHAKGAESLLNDSYMDDIVSGADDLATCETIADDILFTLKKGSMSVKGFSYSSKPPHEDMSSDGVSLGVLGYEWETLEDEMKLDTRDIFLTKIKRGKFPNPVKGDYKDALALNFTKRTLLRVTASVFDPLGIYTPVMAGLKLDLHAIVKLQTTWDQILPNQFLDKWASNLQIIEELRHVKFRRAVIPIDAVSTTPELIVSCDASEAIAVCVIHARYKLRSGGYSCQILTSKSKLVSTSTIPRAELKGARMAAAMGFICIKNFNPSNVKYLSDSTIVLHWLNNDERPLSTAVRNAVIEILRLSSRENWFHIEGLKNIADLGTRTATVDQITMSSDWQNGPDWMRADESSFPIKSFTEIKLSIEEKRLAATETKGLKVADINHQKIFVNHDDKIAERQQFSDYTPNPGRMNFTKLIRCRAAVVKFITNIRKCSKKLITRGTDKDPKNITFTDDELEAAEKYFWKKSTAEVKHFSPLKSYKDHSIMIDGILHYSGRILEGQLVEDVEGLYTDLDPLCFVKPILDRYSTLSYCIMKHCHETLMHHAGGAATFQASRGLAFILQGRDLADEVLQKCPGCTRRRAKKLEVQMGSIHSNRLTIAPCFYYSQVDIFGPFEAMCEHNHRSKVKVYGLLFKCTATAAVAAYCMQAYSTEAFISAFTRFGSRYGYPKSLTVDEGSQIIKGCKEFTIELHDFLRPLTSKFLTSIEFETAPVGHHSATGMAERAIREVRKLFDNLSSGLKLDILQYETAFSYICSELNNLPLGTVKNNKDFDSVDLLSPNRLILGRNNSRSPVGYPTIAKPLRLLKQMETVKLAWWDVWRTELLSEYIPGNSKWRTTKEQPKTGDIIIFLKTGAEADIGSSIWRTGRIKEVEVSKADGLIRTVIIEYKNVNENKFRTTRRSVRTIAILLSVDQL